MKTNEDDLKRAFRAYIQSSPRASGGNCPSPEMIWSLFSGKKSRKRKARIVDHIAACAECHAEFEAFLEIRRAEEKLARDVQPHFRAGLNRAPTQALWRYAAAFFGIIIMASAVMFTLKWLTPNKPPAERGRLSGQLRLLAPDHELDFQKPLVFEWEASPGSEYYVIEIFDESLLPFWTSGKLTETHCEIPAHIKEKMVKGRDYFWMLYANSHQGNKAESSLEAFKFAY